MSAKKTKNPKHSISLIIPMYNESKGFDFLFNELYKVIDPLEEEFEIICINDCSTDDTLEKLKSQHKKDKRVRIIDFSRNFGKEAGLTAGIDFAIGDAVIPIDADLQDPPSLIPQMIEKWHEGYKVVLATRKSRRGEGWLKVTTASIFYKIIGKISMVKIPANTGDFRLMDRIVIDVIKQLPERTRFMKGLFSWAGFETTHIYFNRPNRKRGATSWNYWRLWQFALDGIASFSTVPLKIWTYIGSVISLFAILYAVYLVIRTILFGADVPGYASIMTAILFIGGIQLIGIGILGEYIARIYNESKHRPIYVLKDTIGFPDEKK